MIKLAGVGFVLWVCLSLISEPAIPVRKEKAFDAYIQDSIPIEVELYFTSNHQPDYYKSHVKTPVCKDSLCYLVEIDLIWDLLGNFKNYEVPADKPLTKFDHEEFEENDHKKLKSILADKTSLLRDYEMKTLVDEDVRRASGVVDATTGATSATIKDAVVGGALYTTHTLWHIVNGEVAKKILTHTEARFTDSLLVSMLQSSDYQYQYYALNKVPESKRMAYIPQFVRLVASGDAYVPFFAIEKIPAEAWKQPVTQLQLAELLGRVSFEMQNELLNKFKEMELFTETISKLIQNHSKLTDKQLIKLLTILKDNKTKISENSKQVLENLLKNKNQQVVNLTSDILKN
ncbi:hypothetical protein [Arundinibacter roseus]|uniref:Uncharacterized protein n=1 Tax=Arundinibacter roseus TaxID=2070510 RepID=A0A4R4JU68_9BACT|nr:hypothetical protein [Arundinibacter roseus]TDB58230.1 hypothetical protein EZE20_23215 [Arundinibacter roseus]